MTPEDSTPVPITSTISQTGVSAVSGPGYDGYAFGGKNINFRQMNVLEPVGVSRYQALQVQLTGKLGSWGPFKNAATNVSYALSRFNASATDQDFLSASINNDIPTQYYGPAGADHLHQLGVSLITELPFHFQFSMTNYFRTNGPSNVAAFAERDRSRCLHLGSERRRDRG